MSVQALWPKRNGMLAIDDRQDDRHIEILRERGRARRKPNARTPRFHVTSRPACSGWSAIRTRSICAAAPRDRDAFTDVASFTPAEPLEPGSELDHRWPRT